MLTICNRNRVALHTAPLGLEVMARLMGRLIALVDFSSAPPTAVTR